MADEHTRLTDNTHDSDILESGHQHVNQAQHFSSHTKRLLNSRHISMISIGGIIGTGLFMGIRQTLTNGPIISVISYLYISAICYYIITAVGDMSCYMPLNGSLCQFQFRFISNPVGVMNNFVYWISWSITLGLELGLIYELLCQFMSFNLLQVVGSPAQGMSSDKTWVILLIWVGLTGANLFPVNYYGEIEFLVTIIKVGFMVSWIGLSLGLVVMRTGFTNWSDFNLIWGVNAIEVVNNRVVNKLVNILSSSIVSSCFTFQSIESVGICSGEIENIGRNLPKAIKYIVVRIVVFYIGSLTLLTLMIPSNDKHIINEGRGSDDLMSSPFVVALINLWHQWQFRLDSHCQFRHFNINDISSKLKHLLWVTLFAINGRRRVFLAQVCKDNHTRWCSGVCNPINVFNWIGNLLTFKFQKHGYILNPVDQLVCDFRLTYVALHSD